MVGEAFSEDFKEQVRARTDIVQLIDEAVKLQPQRGGRVFMGLCPFHDDHNPSMNVYPDRQSYRCWSCQAGGDCFSFLMRLESLTFPEALERLATRAGLEMPRRTPQEAAQRNERQSIQEALIWAEGQFHEALKSSAAAKPAREYLRERGFGLETIERFRLGFHPDDWEWIQQRASKRFDPKTLQAARLIAARDSGNGYFDYFVGRVLFPIRDEHGRTVAFGGRILPGNEETTKAKYFNSPESQLFVKNRLVYGFDIAKQSIRQSGTAVVMEGYTDCIMAHEHGVTNAVATLGVALSENHVRLLKRMARKVVLVYDGDEAGIRASERSLASFLGHELDLRILTLADELDPDEFLRTRGGDAFQELVDQAVDVWDFKLGLLLERHGTSAVGEREKTVDEMLELLSQARPLSGTPREDRLLGTLAQRFLTDERVLRADLGKRRRDTFRKSQPSRQPTIIDSTTHETDAESAENFDDCRPFFEKPLVGAEQLEAEILQIVLIAPRTMKCFRHVIGPEDFTNAWLKVLWEHCCDLTEINGSASYRELLSHLADAEGLKSIVVWLGERADEHDIAGKVACANDDDEDVATPYLEGIVETLQLRRERQQHQRSMGSLARMNVNAAPAGELSADAKEMLRRASQFHQKRNSGFPAM